MKASNGLIVGGLLMLAAAGAVRAQDAVQVSPDTHQVRLENDRVRVLDIHVPAGGREKMHRHPNGYVTVALTDCRIKFAFPDGKTAEATIHAGDVTWSDPVTHSGENLGANECHVLNIEPKAAHARKKSANVRGAQAQRRLSAPSAANPRLHSASVEGSGTDTTGRAPGPPCGPCARGAGGGGGFGT